MLYGMENTYLQWMGDNRYFVEKLIKYANMYASVYKKEELYGTSVPISFEQVQVLEYLLENEELNQNMVMIAERLGITTSTFTRLVGRLEKKGLLKKYYIEGNRKDIIIRITDFGRSEYASYAAYLYDLSWKKMFDRIEDVPKKHIHSLADGLENAIWLKPEELTTKRLIPVDEADAS